MNSPGYSEISNLAVTPAVTSVQIPTELLLLVERWPDLTESVRCEILDLANGLHRNLTDARKAGPR